MTPRELLDHSAPPRCCRTTAWPRSPAASKPPSGAPRPPSTDGFSPRSNDSPPRIKADAHSPRPMQQTYIVYVVLAVVFAVALLLIWRASKKRRAVVAPPEEQRPTLEAVPPTPRSSRGEASARREGQGSQRRPREDARRLRRAHRRAHRAQADSIRRSSTSSKRSCSPPTSAPRPRTSCSRRSRRRCRATSSRTPTRVWAVIRKESEAILERAQPKAGPLDVGRAKPFVLLTIGVNGVGKTTTHRQARRASSPPTARR